jgi:hypothetical protein
VCSTLSFGWVLSFDFAFTNNHVFALRMTDFLIRYHIYVSIYVGLCERVADIKTRAHAMKCLTTFCEAVGPGFIFERVSMVVLFGKYLLIIGQKCDPGLSI